MARGWSDGNRLDGSTSLAVPPSGRSSTDRLTPPPAVSKPKAPAWLRMEYKQRYVTFTNSAGSGHPGTNKVTRSQRRRRPPAAPPASAAPSPPASAAPPAACAGCLLLAAARPKRAADSRTWRLRTVWPAKQAADALMAARWSRNTPSHGRDGIGAAPSAAPASRAAAPRWPEGGCLHLSHSSFEQPALTVRDATACRCDACRELLQCPDYNCSALPLHHRSSCRHHGARSLLQLRRSALQFLAKHPCMSNAR